jgi:hypothetical protein
MTAALAPTYTKCPDALAVAGDLREAVGSGGPPVAQHLMAVLYSASMPEALLQDACDELTRNPDAGHLPALPRDPGPTPWPLPNAELWFRLFNLIGERLRRDPNQAIGWACFRACVHGRQWLLDAARLACRDGHLMRQRGGLQLAPSAFDGERMRAEIVSSDTGSHERGDVLRLTWEDTARMVVQSLPGRFGEVDRSVDPE